MYIVIDANIIMAMLIKPGKPTYLFLSDKLEIFAPKQLLEELENNRNLIISKSGLSKEEFDKTMLIFRGNILKNIES